MIKKHYYGLLGLALLSASCAKNILTPQASGPTTPRAATAWQLVWSDEFNGTSLNTANWNIETGNPGVNSEEEAYEANNITVTGGNLVITAQQQSAAGQNYTSGRMNTNGKVSVQYGRIEASIKLPLGQGLWPAFWMLGTNIGSVGWPQCGETDIMEHVNTDNTIYGTIHWYDNGATQYGGNTQTTPTDYHLYAVEWTPQGINWYVDNNLYASANITNNINNTGAFQNPFFIILNMAVGGNFPGQTVDNSVLPASMYVDYVRVYKAVNAPPIGQSITLKGDNGDYVSSENGQIPMTCNRTTASAWEHFTVVDAGNGKVALQGNNGDYVSSENGVNPITCNRVSYSTWEEFTWISNADGSISLEGNNNCFVSSENGTQSMTCNRTIAQGWEDFLVNQ
ncbi:family 16 glycosylhydrolase [Dinghuibacter silviterrae]|uniref:Glycosyl hydrolase family 16 n=1 Tax=Dinghuibacter silviterrae TaxID=1539049 RepID=A0A4R8DGF4_9BACT|nr:family 16 glycosylhydrolase [Dinghuibacter silviterrae]TDW96739.1 glycosyl hydrolase family 16 [Dinghuibacter silviterrae]